MTFKLDSRLAADTFVLSENDERFLLLMNNAAVPWLILVPKVSVIELHDLSTAQYERINAELAELGRWLKSEFQATKINTAAIGNVVEQLHIHIIGRQQQDYCWPNVVWGTQAPATYHASEVDEIKAKIPQVN